MSQRVLNQRLWFTDNRISLAPSSIPGAGLGVFARKHIPAGTIIETSPVLLFSADIYNAIDKPTDLGARNILSDYPFSWSKGRSALAFGWGSLFNHSDRPNVSFKNITEESDGYNALQFRVMKNIAVGEELFIRYAWDTSSLWFMNQEAKPDNV